MPTNQYLAFGTGPGANTLTPASYASSPLLPIGHQPGTALSEVANTTWRQTSVAAAAIATLVTDFTALDMLDDGSVTNYKNGVIAAINHLIAQAQFWQPGDIKGNMSIHIPPGWLAANGQVVSRTGFAALFAAIGTTYGAGDGATSFAVPDLRGEFLRGLDDGRGVDPFRSMGSAQVAFAPPIPHTGWARTGTPIAVGAAAGTLPVSSGNNEVNETLESLNWATSSRNITAGDNRPRNVAVRWLIKT